MHHYTGPFAIPAINSVIPEKTKPWIMILFVIVFQFSGGVYLATANEMAGAKALLQEDILMAGFASLAGMALVFTFMLRLKMRFTTRFAFLVCSVALIICNIVCLYTGNVFVLVTACFFAGMFRMWATFECNSTIQLWLTPKRDLSIFFCFIYLLVNGSILLSGASNIHIAYFSNWEYIHWFIIGSLLTVILLTLSIFNSKRFMRPFPLFGIDWLGGLMWGLILLCVNFICIYGDHYDWWYSVQIKIATLFLMLLLALNFYRASFIRHPFISVQTFKYRATYLPLMLYIIIDILLSPAHLVEHIYFEKILHYDAMQLMYINWIGWMGVLGGAGFALYFFAIRKNSYKSTFLLGFAAVLIYLVLMYFLIDYQTTMEMLVAPLFFRNFGYVVIAIVLISNLVKVPFHHFFQAVSVQAFISAATGSAIGNAILHDLFKDLAASNFELLSAPLDGLNQRLSYFSAAQLSGMLQQQVLMVSFKEVYGYLVIVGISCFIGFLFYKYPYLPVNTWYPKWRTIRKMLKKEIT